MWFTVQSGSMRATYRISVTKETLGSRLIRKKNMRRVKIKLCVHVSQKEQALEVHLPAGRTFQTP